MSLLTLALPFLLVPGQAAPRPRGPAEPLLIEGRVIGPDLRPVVGAALVYHPTDPGPNDAPAETHTDRDGAFRLPVTVRVLYDLRIVAAGLAPKTLRRLAPAAKGLEVKLERGGSITGVVQDASGAPIGGARVRQTERAARDLVLPWEPDTQGAVALTDASGRYRLDALAPGLHTVSATARGYRFAESRPTAAGGRADLVLLPGGSILGTIWDGSGAPVADAEVRAEAEETRGRSWASPVVSTDASGRFAIDGLEAGTYRVVARGDRLAPAWVSGVAVRERDESSAELTLRRAVRVLGRLVGPKGPVTGIVSLSQTDSGPVPASARRLLRTKAGASGRFTIEAPPGRGTLAVDAEGHAHTELDLDVPGGRDAVDLGDVKLDVGLAIAGWVRDPAGQPIEGAQLVVYLFRLRSGRPVEARSHADGSFVLAGLDPGVQRVSVSATGYGDRELRLDAGSRDQEIVLQPAGTIVGLVVDAGGRPVPAAHLKARAMETKAYAPSFPYEADASAEGRFSIEDLPAGRYLVIGSAPGSLSAPRKNVTVDAGQTTDVGRLVLEAGGTIRGSVTDASGRPLPGSGVRLQSPGDRFRRIQELPESTTDVDGRFELTGVPPGRAVVLASHPGYAEGHSAALDVDPEAGPAETQVVLTEGGRIEGRVHHRDGTGVGGLVVRALPLEGPSRFQLQSGPVTAPDGSFVIEHLPAGHYHVAILAGTAGYLRSTESRQVEVADGATTPLDFSLQDVLVSGHLTRGGAPLAGARIRLRPTTGNVTIMMSGNVGSPASGPTRMEALAADDGLYTLIADGPGSYLVTVSTADQKLALPRRTVTIPDTDTDTLDLDFSGAALAGMVVDAQTGEPLTDAFVYAARAGKERSLGANAQTEADGRFRFELAPAEYELRIEADGYASTRRQVTLGEAGLADLRIALAHGFEIRGRVLDDTGHPVGGVAVDAARSGNPSGGAHGTSLPDGSFVVRGLPEGRYQLWAASRLGGFALVPDVSTAAEVVELRLETGGRIRLTARSPAGAPVQGASIAGVRVSGVPVPLLSFAATDVHGALMVPAPAGTVEVQLTAGASSGTVTVDVPAGGTVAAEVVLK